MGVKTTRVVKYIRKGDTGAKGDRGASLRGPQAWGDCATGYTFYSGATGERWVDVVLVGTNYYVCKKTHAKSGSNIPGTAGGNEYWQLGDKVELVATKILLATYALVKNLGVEAIDMKDAAGNVLFQAMDGNVTCKTGTFENVTISGELKGVTGSFKNLNCVNDSGQKVGGISFGSDGKMWLEGDLYNQGYNQAQGRSLRFYTSDVWCRGQFGADERNTLEVFGSYGYYYTKGMANSGTYVAFESVKTASGDTCYKIPLYGTSGDYAGMPVDTVVFRNFYNQVQRYILVAADSHRVLLVNANNNYNNIVVYSNGIAVTLNGGTVREAVQIKRDMLIPAPSSNYLGAGLLLGPVYDNDWTA